jgi:hypothetical protein
MCERVFVTKARGKICGAWPCALLLLAAALLAPAARAQEGRRIAPPPGVTCDRDRLTSFTGRVTRYLRTYTNVALGVRTDEATSEAFMIRFPRSPLPTKNFLLNGEPFKASDWKKVELARGRLRAGMRATVWVCEDGTTPSVVDWRPGPKPAGVF